MPGLENELNKYLLNLLNNLNCNMNFSCSLEIKKDGVMGSGIIGSVAMVCIVHCLITKKDLGIFKFKIDFRVLIIVAKAREMSLT